MNSLLLFDIIITNNITLNPFIFFLGPNWNAYENGHDSRGRRENFAESEAMLGISGWRRRGCGRCLHWESWKPVLRETGRGKVWPKFACFFPKGEIPAPSLGQGKVNLHWHRKGWGQGRSCASHLVQLAAARGGYPEGPAAWAPLHAV